MKLLALSIPGANGEPIQIHGVSNMPEGGPTNLSQIVQTGLNVLILAAIILCLLFLVWGGINWLMSEGEKQRISSARQKIVYAVLGLIVVFFSFLIINAIYYFLFKGSVSPLNYGQ